jgi:hypothetical protein
MSASTQYWWRRYHEAGRAVQRRQELPELSDSFGAKPVSAGYTLGVL